MKPAPAYNVSGAAPVSIVATRVSIVATSNGLENAALWHRDPKTPERVRRNIEEGILTALSPFLEQQARRCEQKARRYEQKARQRVEFEDALQSAKIGVVKALTSWDPAKGRFWSWCFICVRSSLRDACRKSDPSTLLTDPSDFDLQNTPEPSLSLEMRLDLARALSELPDRVRTVIELVYLDGHTAAEVAQMMGLTRARVGQITKEGRACLKASLADLFPSDAVLSL